MKKLGLLLSLISLCVVCLFLLTSCSDKLETPGNFKLDDDTQVLTWPKCKNAESYTVVIGETEIITRSNSYSLEKLEAGNYIIKICANGDGKEYKNSEFGEYEFKRDPETGLRYKLINNKTEYQLVNIGTASGDVVMESVYRNKPVTSIAASALAGNSRITSFKIGDYVKEIGKKAFYNNKALTSVIIPEGVTTIGENAFQACSNLKSVTLPSTITVIPNLTFAYCQALETLTLGSNTVSIGERAFIDCEMLTAINIPDSVETIGASAFSSCESAKTITIGANLKDIPKSAFYRCYAVETITIGNKVESIGQYAFSDCSELTSIIIPDSVKSIDYGAFAYDKKLTNITLGSGVTNMGAFVFFDTKVYNDSADVVYVGEWIVGCKNPEIEQAALLPLLRPDATIGIAAEAFATCTSIEQVKLPNVKYICDYAFWGCNKLQGYPALQFSNELETIGMHAFAQCSFMDRFNFGNVITEIGAYAFYDCPRLNEVDLPDSLKKIGTSAFDKTAIYNAGAGLIYADNWLIGAKSVNSDGPTTIKDGTVGIADYCFYKNYMLGEVVLPSSLKYIGKAAFYECIFINIKTIPVGVKEIGDYAFYNCVYASLGNQYLLTLPLGLESIGRSAFYQAQLCGVIIPGTVKTIGDYAFFGCQLLGAQGIIIDEAGTTINGRLVLGNGIESIGNRAFYNCAGLTDLVIPDSVTQIGERVFNKCASLKNVTIGSGITEVADYMFYNCASIESINLSDSITRIGKYAFRGCEKLTNITFGNSVSVIDNFAFLGCVSLNGVAIPSTVTEIGKYAFRGLTSASSIIIGNNVETIGQHAFYGCNIATIYCEDESIMPYWDKYFNSSFRPIVYGVTLSDDKTYVVSFVRSDVSIDNDDAISGITAPRRSGYTFDGWATSPSGAVEYTAADVVNAPAGTTLYAKYSEKQN